MEDVTPAPVWRGHGELEEWRPVPGWEGLYEVSGIGGVRSVDRTIHYKDGRRRFYPGAPLKGGTHKFGYPMVNLSRNKEVKGFAVHQLVALAFIGPCPEGQEVRHLDDDPTNNSFLNLAYGTHAENMADMMRHGRSRRQEFCGRGHEMTEENRYLSPSGGMDCRRCSSERNKEWREAHAEPPKGHRNARKTECIRGHPFDEENTYIRAGGTRECRTCMRETQRNRKKKAA